MFQNVKTASAKHMVNVSTCVRALFVVFYNWIFNVQMVTVSNRDGQGFNVYEYQASPTSDRNQVLVTFRHTRNGHQVDYWVAKLPAQDWAATRQRLIDSGRYAY